MANQKLFDNAWLNIPGAAARTPFGQVLAERRQAGELAPLRLVPAECAGYFATILTADQSGHRFDLQPV